MKVFLLTDIEGIGGVDDIEFIDKENEKYKIARHELSRSISLATEACFEAGAEKVYYLDGHGGGGNIIPEEIDERAVLVTVADWHSLMESGEIDCLIELGAHARAGTIGGFLDHTISSKSWFMHKVNGVEMSEISMQALICSVYNVPVVACIGDKTVCEQTKEYIPDIYVGEVKNADCRNKAETYPDADEILVDTVKRSLANYKSVSLYTLDAPYTVELTYYRSDMCDEAFAKCTSGEERVDARTIRRTLPRLAKYKDLFF